MQSLIKLLTALAAFSIISYFIIVPPTRLYEIQISGRQNGNRYSSSNKASSNLGFKFMRSSLQNLQEVEDPANAVKNVPGGCEAQWKIRIRHAVYDKFGDMNLRRTVGGKLRIFVVAAMRTGSSFLGNILNSYPASYYLFEPFSKYGFDFQVRLV